MLQRKVGTGGGHGRGRSRRGGPRRSRRAAGILVVLACSLLVSFRTASAQDVRPAAPPAGGHLLLRDDAGRERIAPVLEVDVALRVAGMVARGTALQRFRNPSDHWLEATYVFPLPEGAAVDGLRMRIGDRRIEGEIREREEARRSYETARAEGRRASLLEQHRPNAFSSRIANVPPRSEIEVEIDFQQTVSLAARELELRLPWIVAPRYFPEPPTSDEAATLAGPEPEASPSGARPDVALALDLDAGFALETIASPTHAIALEQLDVHRFLVTLREGAVPADRDFVLRWRPTPGSQPRAAIFSEEKNGHEYVLLMMLPPDPESAATGRGAASREVVFVIDTSGSMGGASIEQARAALRLAIARLGPMDRFNVIAFDSDTRLLFPRPTFADPPARARALEFVADLEADGGTRMLPALRAALHDEAGGPGLRQIVFVTDGCVGNERELFAAVREGLGRSRLFTVGIGSAPNGHFMEGAARFGRGARVSIDSPEEVGTRMEALFEKLERPALTDLEILWPDRTESWPERLPDLYPGEPLLVAARLSRFLGEVVVRGRLGDRPWQASLALSPGRRELGIEKLFGRRKIASLMDGLAAGEDPERVRRDVTETALEHGLVSRYTSLVAVERTPVRPRSDGLVAAPVEAGAPAGLVLPQGATPAPALLALAVALAASGGACRWLGRRRVAP